MKGAYPVLVAMLDFIEVIFHFRSKFRVNDLLEVILHKIGDDLTEIGRLECLSLMLNVTPCCDSGDSRSVGTWSADAVLFECLDE